MTQLYKQCRLQKGNQFDVAYVPAEFAIKGKFLKIRGIDGWKVVGVHHAASVDEVNSNSRDFLRTRKASDI